jgi:hypothetical protein
LVAVVEVIGFLVDAMNKLLSMEIIPGISYYTLILIGFIGAAIAIVVGSTHD